MSNSNITTANTTNATNTVSIPMSTEDLTPAEATARREKLAAEHEAYLRKVATSRTGGQSTKVYSSLARAGGTTWTEYRTEKAREDARLAALDNEALESQRQAEKQQSLEKRQGELAAGKDRRAAKRQRDKEKKKKGKEATTTAAEGEEVEEKQQPRDDNDEEVVGAEKRGDQGGNPSDCIAGNEDNSVDSVEKGKEETGKSATEPSSS